LNDDVSLDHMRLDSNDFATLYDRHAGELLGFFVRRAYDPEVGVDLVAETFAVAFRDRRQFRGEDLAAARAWLYGIARHRLAMFFRRGRVERRAVARLGVERRALTELEYDRIEELAASDQLRELLAVAIDALVPEQRDALRLRVVDGRPYCEVAHELGISEQTARARTSRALRNLRESAALRDLMEATGNAWLDDLPILGELDEQLQAGFRRNETRRRPLSRRFAAVAAGTALAVIVVLAWGIGGGFVSSEASAAQALRAAADAASRQPDSFPKPNQFFYIRWLSRDLVPIRRHADEPLLRADESLPKAVVTTETREWWSTTRLGRIESRVLSVTFPTAAGRALWVALGRPRLGDVPPPTGIAPGPIEIPLDPHVLSLSQVLALPTDPRELYRRLFASGTALTAIEDVRQLDLNPIGSSLRAALYRVLAMVPGVQLVGEVPTLTGRVGEAIGADGEELIIDPRTGTMLGVRNVVTKLDAGLANLPVGTVVGQLAIIQRAITDKLAPPL
jgi:RNA polymerase sigma-70 factor (ECF subfamily)